MYNQYPQMMPQYQQRFLQPQQQFELIRVSGIDGARAYQMPPNSTVALFDGCCDIMYIKTTDGAGFPTIRQFSFAPIELNTEQKSDYVTRKEFDELKELVTNGKQSIRNVRKSEQSE